MITTGALLALFPASVRASRRLILIRQIYLYTEFTVAYMDYNVRLTNNDLALYILDNDIIVKYWSLYHLTIA